MAQVIDGGGGNKKEDPIDIREYFLEKYGTPPEVPSQERDALTDQARKEAQSGYALDDPERQRVEERGGYGLYFPPPQLQTGFQELDQNWYGQRDTGINAPADEAALAAAQQQYLESEAEEVRRRFSRYAGDLYYQGGSEQATLGVFRQQLANLGMLSAEELGFLGVTPTDKMSYILSPADTRRLTSDDPAQSTYAGELRDTYGDDWFDQLYTTDPETGWSYLSEWGDVDEDAGGWGGYGGGYGGYGGGGGYGGTYQAAAKNGLLSWRIGF